MRFALAAILLFASCSRTPKPPLSPADELATFRLNPQFEVALFAAEPMVLDPVDMAFDEQGRAYVADMLDLPWDPPQGKPARSRIVLLEDRNGDGRSDHGTIFAENVLQVSGLLPWNGGLIVPAAPNIYFMKDTNGDGRADVREVLFTGFFQGNPEAQITNPRLGLDNWIYFSNTGNAGRITSPKYPHLPPVEVRGADFRFHPIRILAEAASGAAQYGSTFDDWGNRFISQNTQHLRHVVVPRHYLARAPLLDVPSVNHDPYGDRERLMWPLSRTQDWRVKRTAMRQQRYDEMKTGRTEHASGHITGAAGGTVYNGDAWPGHYRGNIFTGDVSGNLVRRDILSPDGVTFSAAPPQEGVEFLASTDQWFRPTCFANAPDGNLYMMDMYREIIETPLSIPEELKKDLDFYSGDRQGRIWRLSSKSPRNSRPLNANLDKLSTEQLVLLLEHENGWHRQTAQRLIVERAGGASASAIRAFLDATKSPVARVHALWTLEGLGKLSESDLLPAFAHPHAGIREHAVRLSESLPRSEAIERALLGLVSDPEIRVRYQVAFTLGLADTPARRAALISLAAAGAGNAWIRTAVLSSASNWPVAFFEAFPEKDREDWARAVGSLVGARRIGGEVAAFLGALSRANHPAAGLDGLSRGLAMASVARLSVAGAERLLSRFTDSPDDRVANAAWQTARRLVVPALAARAAGIAADESAPIERRVAALGAVADLHRLQRILASNPPARVQAAAVSTLAALPDAAAAKVILDQWKAYSPDARTTAIAAMLQHRDRVPLLLQAISEGRVPASLIDITARIRLLEDSDPSIASRAKALFQSAGGDRAKVVAAYRDALQLQGNPGKGREYFEDACARCHSPRREGGRIGPDLAGINNKTREELLEAILNPSAAIEPRYVNYIVTTTDNRTFDGVLASETAGSITLRGGTEDDVTILRARIRDIRSSSISLMPENLEEGLSRQGLADLIAFLRGE
jgi:putative membrane-bound dehydrogenase-like protein